MKFLRKQSKTEAYAEELGDLFYGLPIKVRRGEEGQWRIEVGMEFVITTLGWRLVGARRIIVAAEDDGLNFGLPAPVCAESEADRAIDDAVVGAVKICSQTGDFSLFIGDALRLEVLTWSSGYETWQLWRNGEFYGAVGSEGLR